MHVKILDERVVRRAKSRGLDALVYAPHFVRLPEIERRARAHSDEELLVVPARELFTGSWRDRKHVLALGLSEPVPDFLTLAGTMAELERQDAAVLIPHPAFLTVSCAAADVRRYRDSIAAVETYNPKHWARHNRRARALAGAADLPAFGSSYAHRRGTIGEVWTAFPEPLDDGDALVSALEAGVDRRVRRRSGPRHRARCVAEFGHLGYENTVAKAGRLRSGTEPTHPGHPAYGGRFDDVRVY
jgi:predicted metal-dependent phosphoesterase TrpH